MSTESQPARQYVRRSKIERPAPMADAAAAPAADTRPDLRPDLRAAPREDDPRARAAKRAAEIKGHLPDRNDSVNEFHIDTGEIPDGWSYEWKRHTTLGAEDPSYQVSLAQNGWEPVPVSRHPNFMPSGWRGQVIERKGMVLMERPAEITKMARDQDQADARERVSSMEEKLAGVEPGHFERKNKGAPLAKVGKSYAPMAIPE